MPHNRRLLDEIGMREVATREQRDVGRALRIHTNGRSVLEISETLDVPESFVTEIIRQASAFKQQSFEKPFSLFLIRGSRKEVGHH